jgi:lipoprotein-anchoring transpeptidase ErfK/SrfK
VIRRVPAALVVGAALVAAPGARADVPVAPGSPATSAAGAGPGAPTRTRAWIAHPTAPVTATSRPGGGAKLYEIGSRAPWNGGPVRLLVREQREVAGERWLRVLLPRRPNGTAGWIPASGAVVAPTPWRILVSRRLRTVRVLRAGRTVRRFRAVIGARSTPTPAGLFAIAERVRQPDPDAFVGAWVLHLTGFSDVLDDYGGGPGRLAIHGRGTGALGDPLGSARSHGCVRLTNGAVRWLAAHVREGTPVVVR